ncbi:MAG: hypothetical protein JSS89_02045 [Bacteroidetes bacterium]|nr:hypothetical protein [Bacteroidota bacterium]
MSIPLRLACLLLITSTALADTTVVSREVRLATDSTYQQFVLDSLRAENEAQLHMQTLRGNDTEHRYLPFVALTIPIIAIIGLVVILWRRGESNRQIRLAMIEKGMDPSLLVERSDENPKKYASMRFGLLATGAGLGLIVGSILVNTTNLGDHAPEHIVLSSLLLFSGAGLVVYHIIARKLERTSSGA